MTKGDTRGRLPIRAGQAGLALGVVGAGLAYLELIPPLTGFILFVIGGLAGLIGVAGGIFTSLRHGLNTGRAGIYLGLLPAIALIVGALPIRNSPGINDITTDIKHPPVFAQALKLGENRGRDMSFPKAFGPIIRKSYPGLAPVYLNQSQEKTLSRVVLIAGGMPRWTLTYVDGDAGIVEGFEKSLIFRFVDDFVIRIRPKSAKETRVDMRSKSRDGQGDLGANAKRIHSFLRRLQATNR